jgi:hypothetical protein
VHIKEGEKGMVDSKIIMDLFELLNKNNFNYVLIKNDGDLLPNHLESGKDIDFLIHPSEYDRLIKVVTENGYEKRAGESCKRYFLYQLREDIFLRKEDCYFHFYEALSCNPLTNMGKCKMPLETLVQTYIWNNKKWDATNKWWIMDDVSILLYLIVRSVFDKMYFREIYIREIKKRIKYINSEIFYKLADTVFYGFTTRMIELVKLEKYESILNEYLSYRDY